MQKHAGNMNYAGNLHDLGQIVDSIPNSDADSVKFTGSPADMWDMMKEINSLKDTVRSLEN